jgi:hypothetical protein
MDCGPDRTQSNDLKDLRDQGVVLIHVLELQPAHLSLAELIREVMAGSAAFDDADRFQRAARDLVGAGLLFESGDLVLPTRAASRFNEIVAVGI